MGIRMSRRKKSEIYLEWTAEALVTVKNNKGLFVHDIAKAIKCPIATTTRILTTAYKDKIIGRQFIGSGGNWKALWIPNYADGHETHPNLLRDRCTDFNPYDDFDEEAGEWYNNLAKPKIRPNPWQRA